MRWATALGAVVVVLGLFLIAVQANEAMKWAVLPAAMPVQGMPQADCPAGELAEEGLSIAECEYMVDQARGMTLSAPPWFVSGYRWLALAGAAAAAFSLIGGGVLVCGRSGVALAGLAALLAIDAAQFALAVNAGPVIRAMYVANIALWVLLHAALLAAVFAGRQAQAKPSDAV